MLDFHDILLWTTKNLLEYSYLVRMYTLLLKYQFQNQLNQRYLLEALRYQFQRHLTFSVSQWFLHNVHQRFPVYCLCNLYHWKRTRFVWLDLPVNCPKLRLSTLYHHRIMQFHNFLDYLLRFLLLYIWILQPVERHSYSEWILYSYSFHHDKQRNNPDQSKFLMCCCPVHHLPWFDHRQRYWKFPSCFSQCFHHGWFLPDQVLPCWLDLNYNRMRWLHMWIHDCLLW